MGQSGATQLGSPLLLATAQPKMQGDSHSQGGTPICLHPERQNLNEGMRRQAEMGKMAGGSSKGEFQAQECHYILFFKG